MDLFLSLGKGFTSHDAFWMWAIFMVQVASVVVIIERILVLYRRRPNQKEVGLIISEGIRAGNLRQSLDQAQSLLHQEPIAEVAIAGIQAALDHQNKETMQSKMDEVLLREQKRMEKHIGLLAVFANVSTLLGLLGTISGLVKAITHSSGNQEAVLSEAISLGMNTTAYGLLVAVPALITYAILQNRATRLTEDLNRAALNLFIHLGYHQEPDTRRT